MGGRKPNILLISIDSFRADEASFCSAAEGTTPFIDSYSTGATVFDRAISPTTWTMPSHASAFTGLYPPEHAVTDLGDSLGDSSTIAEVLSQQGYETRSYGYLEWFQAGDILRGFDHTVTSLFGGDIRSDFSVRLSDAILDVFGESRWQFQEFVRGLSFRDLNRDDDRTIATVLKDAEVACEPFCYFVHLNTVHWPYVPPKPYHRAFSDDNRLELMKNRSYWQQKIYYNRGEVATGDISPPDATTDRIFDQYRGAVRQVDDQVRRLLTGLADAVDMENTIVALFADHGDNIGEDGLYGHHFSVSDALIRVPLLVRDPTGTLSPGVRSDVVQTTDIYQTIMELLGLSVDRAHSESVLEKDNREYAFTYYEPPDSFIDHVGRERVEAAGLTARKYCVWKSPDQKLVWEPEKDQYTGTDNDELRTALHDHYSSLLNERSAERGDVPDHVRQRLEQIGYL